MADFGYEEIAGSGRLRVTTDEAVSRALEVQRDAATDAEELTGLFGELVSEFWTGLSTSLGWNVSPTLIHKVWVVNRCLQLNSQQIATMPLRFFGPSTEPAWVANPDPNWYPNGIGDAVFAAVWSMYSWGDAFILVTDRYANSGLPRTWTVLDPAPMDVRTVRGSRRYKSGNQELNPDDVIQISRNPGGVRGTSALSAYGSYIYGLLATAEMARQLSGESGVPNTVLRPKKQLNADQAAALQAQWAARTSARRGAPAILPPDIEYDQLAFSPKDLLLLDVQLFDAQVIASAFGVPPYMLNIPIEGGLTYQTPVLAGEHWWRFELLPASARIQRALSAMMLPRGSWVEFDARATLAPSFPEMVEAWVKLQGAGIVTNDETRAAVLNLPPQPEDEALADILTPPTASASPAQQQSASVVALRPTGVSP
jgi:HK97 family phage portal protein